MEHLLESAKQHEHAAGGPAGMHRATSTPAPLHPALQLQQQAGNQAIQELFRAGVIHAKLAISNSDDADEREADNIAHQVMRADASFPAAVPCSCAEGQEMCEECLQKAATPAIHRRASAQAAPSHVPDIVSQVLHSPGHPLDSATRAFFEPRFGHDFSHVRVHTDSQAADSAKEIHAQGYTAGHDVVFGTNQFSPMTAEGQKLLAHELAHVVQQSAGAKVIQRAPDRDDGSPAESLVDKYRPGFYSPIQKQANQAFDSLAAELHQHIREQDYRFVREAFEHIPDEYEDDVAFALVDRLALSRLEQLAATSDGRALLDVLYNALITGVVHKDEREAADRILKAKAKYPGVRERHGLAKNIENPLVFALKNQPFFGDCYATLRAELMPSGRVKAFYDTYRPTSRGRCPEFWPDASTILRRFGEYETLHGFELDPDEIVFVKLYDQTESPTPTPVLAIQLIDFANQQKEDTLGKIKTVSILAATLGFGAVGGAGILGWVDTIAFAINVGSLAVNEFRHVIAKTAFGREFLEVWDLTEKITEYYGWARLGVDGLRAVHSRVSPALKKWKGEAPTKGLSSAEQKTIQEVQGTTEKWVSAVKDAEVTEAEKYLAAHPPKEVKGNRGNRHADIDGNHAVVEVSTGTCDFYSSTPTRVPCPWGGPKKGTQPAPGKGAARSAVPGRHLEYQYIEALKEQCPKLKPLDIRPKARASASRSEGAPESSFEERMQTTQGNYSLAVYGPEEKVVIKGKERMNRYQVLEIDGISVDRWIEEIKIEQRFHKVDDIVTQLRREADFAEAYGLEGVRYSIAGPEVAREVEAEVARTRLKNVYRVH